MFIEFKMKINDKKGSKSVLTETNYKPGIKTQGISDICLVITDFIL